MNNVNVLLIVKAKLDFSFLSACSFLLKATIFLEGAEDF